MSLKTWINEFYPVKANKCSKSKALEHSILKWTGLQRSHLKRHRVNINPWGDLKYKSEYFDINDSTCALCHVYHPPLGCKDCPLAIVRDGVACVSMLGNEKLSPFAEWVQYSNPKPMLSWLKKALAMVKKEAKSKSRRRK